MTMDVTPRPYRNQPYNPDRPAGKGILDGVKAFKLNQKDLVDATSPDAPEHMRKALEAAAIQLGRSFTVAHPMLAKADGDTLRLLKIDSRTKGAIHAARANPRAQLGDYRRADTIRNTLRDLIATLEKATAELDDFIAEEYPRVTPELLAEMDAEAARARAERNRRDMEARARARADLEQLDAEMARQRAARAKAERDKEARVKAIIAQMEAEAGLDPQG